MTEEQKPAPTPEEVIAAVHGTTGAGAAGPLGMGVALSIVAALKEGGYVIGTHYVEEHHHTAHKRAHK